MSGEFGSDFITISDEEGNDFLLEHLDTIEVDDVYYMAFLPADIEEDDEDYGLIILKVTEEEGEDILTSIDDEDLLEDIHSRFIGRLIDEEDLHGDTDEVF